MAQFAVVKGSAGALPKGFVYRRQGRTRRTRAPHLIRRPRRSDGESIRARAHRLEAVRDSTCGLPPSTGPILAGAARGEPVTPRGVPEAGGHRADRLDVRRRVVHVRERRRCRHPRRRRDLLPEQPGRRRGPRSAARTVLPRHPAAVGVAAVRRRGAARRAVDLAPGTVRHHVRRPRTTRRGPGRQHAAGPAAPVRRRRDARGRRAAQRRRGRRPMPARDRRRGRLRRPLRGQGEPGRRPRQAPVVGRPRRPAHRAFVSGRPARDPRRGRRLDRPRQRRPDGDRRRTGTR